MSNKTDSMVLVDRSNIQRISSEGMKKYGSLIAFNFGHCKPKIYIPVQLLPVYPFNMTDYLKALAGKLSQFLIDNKKNSLSVLYVQPTAFEPSHYNVTPEEVAYELFFDYSKILCDVYVPDKYDFINSVIESHYKEGILYIAKRRIFDGDWHRLSLKHVNLIFDDELQYLRNRDKEYTWCILDLIVKNYIVVMYKHDYKHLVDNLKEYSDKLQQSINEKFGNKFLSGGLGGYGKNSYRTVMFYGDTQQLGSPFSFEFNSDNVDTDIVKLYVYPNSTLPVYRPSIPSG